MTWGRKMRSSNHMNWRIKLCGLVLLLAGYHIAVAQINDPPPVPVTPSYDYVSFINKFSDAQKVDAFYFIRNFPEFKGKLIMVDARFRKKISYNMSFIKMWRNFGNLTMILTDIPAGETFPETDTFLVVGQMTGYKNEVVDGVLESMPIIKFMGKYVCVDFRCNQ